MSLQDMEKPIDVVSSPYHLLRRASQYAATLYLESAGVNDLTQRQCTVLLCICDNEGISQTELVKMTGIDRSTLADLVARLKARSYLQIQRSKTDGRSHALRITAGGRNALDAALPNVSDVDEKLLEAVPKSKRNSFIAALKAIAKHSTKPAARANSNNNTARNRPDKKTSKQNRA